jgi:hypothetical protein
MYRSRGFPESHGDFPHGLTDTEQRSRFRVPTFLTRCDTGMVKSWSCTSCAFIPISLRRFPPLAKGGSGGVVPARPVTRSSHALSLSVLSHPSRKARRIVFAFQRLPHHPPLPPPSQGGERDRSLATSFHRAQQKHASRNRPSSSVNTNFSPAQCDTAGVENERVRCHGEDRMSALS